MLSIVLSYFDFDRDTRISLALFLLKVNTSLNSFMGYGPVVPNGYGTSYNPQANQIIFCITAFNACPETSAKLFSDTLESVLTEMRDLCLSCPTPSPRDTKLSLSTITESKQKSSEKKQQINGTFDYKSTPRTIKIRQLAKIPCLVPSLQKKEKIFWRTKTNIPDLVACSLR